MTESYRPRGMYFEEFQVGNEVISQGRTITEADIMNFAGLTWDTNPMHTDAEYAKTTAFGERVAHGMLGLSYAVGLAWQRGFMEGTVIAFTGLECKFKAPIKIGDTVRLAAKIKHTKEMRAAGGGFVVFDYRLLNQRDETVTSGEWTVLVKGKA